MSIIGILYINNKAVIRFIDEPESKNDIQCVLSMQMPDSGFAKNACGSKPPVRTTYTLISAQKTLIAKIRG